MTSNKSPPHYVYVFRSKTYGTKVGHSSDPYHRLTALQSEKRAKDIEIAHTQPVSSVKEGRLIEQTAHSFLSIWHSHSEWFNCTSEQAICAIAQAATRHGVCLKPPSLPERRTQLAFRCNNADSFKLDFLSIHTGRTRTDLALEALNDLYEKFGLDEAILTYKTEGTIPRLPLTPQPQEKS